MLVQCPNCHTTYRVADNLVTVPTPTFRCSRCKHTFVVATRTAHVEEKATGANHSSEQPEQEERELTFDVSRRGKKEAGQETDDGGASLPVSEQQPVTSPEEGESPWTMTSNPSPRDEPFFISEADPTPDNPSERTSENQLQFERNWENPLSQEGGGENILALDPYRDRQISTLPYLTLLGALIVFYSLLTVMQQSQPQRVETVIRNIPWVGSLIFSNDHLKHGIVLQSVRSSLQTILGNRQVFVVTGVALNQNSASVRDVQVRGQVYGTDGKELDHQMIWVGNAISPRIIRGMTAQDISDLQRLRPLRTFEIPPGESVPFTIVFLKSAKGIGEFSCQVLSAESGS